MTDPLTAHQPWRLPHSETRHMRSYVILAGVIFGLLAVVHLWRVAIEPHLARDPWFLLVTVAAAVLGLAAWRVVRRSPPS